MWDRPGEASTVIVAVTAVRRPAVTGSVPGRTQPERPGHARHQADLRRRQANHAVLTRSGSHGRRRLGARSANRASERPSEGGQRGVPAASSGTPVTHRECAGRRRPTSERCTVVCGEGNGTTWRPAHTYGRSFKSAGVSGVPPVKHAAAGEITPMRVKFHAASPCHPFASRVRTPPGWCPCPGGPRAAPRRRSSPR